MALELINILDLLWIVLEFNRHLDPFLGRSRTYKHSRPLIGRSETFCGQWSQRTVSELIVQSSCRDNSRQAIDLGPSGRPGILYDYEDSSFLGLSTLSETFCGQ